MDLGSGSSIIESGGDDGAIARKELENVDEIKEENNESREVKESVDSPLTAVEYSPSPVTIKGFGLKKWRRIRREVNKDGSSKVDSTSKMLKRVLPNSALNSAKPVHFSTHLNQKSEGSVSSTEAAVRKSGVAADSFVLIGDLGRDDPPSFATGADSDNSEDRSSKSSTAASAPKMRHEFPTHGRDKNKMKGLGGKNMASSIQRNQHQKGLIETSKKPRGDQVKVEKDNSYSSMESDSRSSNFVFMQDPNCVVINGRQNGRSMSYGGENSDEAQGGEQQFNEELQTGYGRIAVEFEDVLQTNLSWEAKEEKSENHGSSSDQDPLVESIVALQSVQEALEKEILELREIGDKDTLGDPTLANESEESTSRSLETQVITLNQTANRLETKLEEAQVKLNLKEAQVVELEAKSSSSSNLDTIFMQKIESEVEYVAISRAIQQLRVATSDQINVLQEQKSLADKIGYAEGKAVMLKERADKLVSCCEHIVGADEVLNLQNRVFKFTSCFCIQLMLLMGVLALFVLKLSMTHTDEAVVPT